MIRIFDIIFSSFALLIISPLFIPICLILRFTGEGEIFYLQSRVGINGKKFNIIKFATMLRDSPNMQNAYITTRNDPRVLPFGNFLRKYKINELPQIINILIGDISIVGPRPQVQSHLDLYPKESLDEILELKPGLTGIASIFFRDEEELISRSELDSKDFYGKYIVPYKVELELWYKKNKNIRLYFVIIFVTFLAVLKSKNEFHKLFKGLPTPPKELLF